MRAILILISLIIVSELCLGQSSMFKIYPNGLIYSDSTINNLRKIADSLNLQFTKSESNYEFYSKPQAIANLVEIRKEDLIAAKKDIANNISFKDFIAKYPNTIVDDSLLVLRYKSRNPQYDFVDFRPESIKSIKNVVITIWQQPDIYNQKLKNKWITYPFESNYAYFFLEEFESKPLPEKYAKMIQYSICLIDTNAHLFKETIYGPDSTGCDKLASAVELFLGYVNKNTNKPNRESFDNEKDYLKALQQYDSIKFSIIDNSISNQSEFQELLKNAISESLKNGGTNYEFEEYVGKYYSKKTELDLKLNRQIVEKNYGVDSYRSHAMDIAILSAETANWSTFLRAHLNIFDYGYYLHSDKSWHLNPRHSYIKELEKININTVDLLLGTCFRIQNSDFNKYSGSILSVGHAIAETQNANDFEHQILDLIKDDSLDDYNRINMYQLFQTYYYDLSDEIKKAQNKVRLNEAAKELPSYISSQVFTENYQFKKLLKNEMVAINENFEIINSHYGESNLINWDPRDEDCLTATLKPKDISQNIQFLVQLSKKRNPFSIKSLLSQKDSILARVYEAKFLIDQLKKDSLRQLVIFFTTDQSFSKTLQKTFIDELPANLKEKYSNNLDDIIFASLKNEFGQSHWLIFPDKNIMLWGFSDQSPLENYSKKELGATKGLFPNSFKIFNSKGKIINK